MCEIKKMNLLIRFIAQGQKPLMYYLLLIICSIMPLLTNYRQKGLFSTWFISNFIFRVHITNVAFTLLSSILSLLLIIWTVITRNVKLYFVAIILLNRSDIWRMLAWEVSKMIMISHDSAVVIYIWSFHIWIDSETRLIC